MHHRYRCQRAGDPRRQQTVPLEDLALDRDLPRVRGPHRPQVSVLDRTDASPRLLCRPRSETSLSTPGHEEGHIAVAGLERRGRTSHARILPASVQQRRINQLGKRPPCGASHSPPPSVVKRRESKPDEQAEPPTCASLGCPGLSPLRLSPPACRRTYGSSPHIVPAGCDIGRQPAEQRSVTAPAGLLGAV